jgi:acyl carrier protein phosphodiesterase
MGNSNRSFGQIMTELYQLHIDKEVVPDWFGCIYHSHLYPSREQCLKGCLTDELFDIAAALGEHWDAWSPTEEYPEINDYTDAGVLEKCYHSQDEEIMQYIEKVKEWLKTDAVNPFYGDGSLEINILTFSVAE